MSQENVQIVRSGYEHFQATGDLHAQSVAPGFVWDMSKFGGVVDQQVYEGLEATRSFIQDWNDAWAHWEIEVDRFHDAGDQVVAVVQFGSEATAQRFEKFLKTSSGRAFSKQHFT